MTPYLQQRSLYPPLIQNRPSLVLGMVVVIPCYDEPDILRTLLCLQQCTLPSCDVEVIVVINDAENSTEKVKNCNQRIFYQLENWASQQNNTKLKFHILYQDRLPKKYAGVGMARKIGIDEAVWRLEKVGQKNGVIACFDADSRCQKNYFVALEDYFDAYPKIEAVCIHFEHPLEGIEYEETIYASILLYELHLRYYVHIQKWTGFPFAFQTIGSSMAVRSGAYQQQGGMNRRKAGEDFYFLQKFIELNRVGELTSTTVFPSPRTSNRVPFGTGKAVQEIQKSPSQYTTYAVESFVDLKLFFELIPMFFELKEREKEEIWHKMPNTVQAFLNFDDFFEKLMEIHQNTTNLESFRHRFFRWFNAFQLMKFVHFTRDNFYPNIHLDKAVNWLCGYHQQSQMCNKEMLFFLRKKDKGKVFL